MTAGHLMGTSRPKPAPLTIADGTLEALKWLALLLMTGDHVNRYLFDATLPLLFELGRLALPIFVVVLAVNLSRPGTLRRGVYPRTLKRLGLTGTIASVPFVALNTALGSGWLPLNVLFTLLVLTATLYLIERGELAAAGVVLLVGGNLVEYWWFGLALGVATWRYCRQPSIPAAVAALLACAGLGFINGNGWALAAVPLILCATRVRLSFPRLRWMFYAYYPLHLAAIWLIRMSPLF
ncbi:conjugal transfer protein TrbP [Marinobacterium nitratireducens]|uniref:Conjugal transfer protein TrbP n=1 Tax=Marinobacterium nitratireducens TaxID=518897 RepID=A0A917ZGM0_9GAMM|nr:TraX family protein [Marinobacterium nitratireducens]GGO81699.1 conjugal transfer protein TrbP [Marinobacterium nitratireducens]